MLEVRRDLGYLTPDLDRVPAPALPHGALVYAITPLADERILDVLRDMAERGNPVVVIEIPTGDPRVDPSDEAAEFALRLWRLDREALRFSLVERGIPVVAWDGAGECPGSRRPDPAQPGARHVRQIRVPRRMTFLPISPAI